MRTSFCSKTPPAPSTHAHLHTHTDTYNPPTQELSSESRRGCKQYDPSIGKESLISLPGCLQHLQTHAEPPQLIPKAFVFFHSFSFLFCLAWFNLKLLWWWSSQLQVAAVERQFSKSENHFFWSCIKRESESEHFISASFDVLHLRRHYATWLIFDL